MYRPPLPLVPISVTSSRDLRVMERLEGLSQRKDLISPSGIEPANFRVVAQSLKELLHHVPLSNVKYLY
jgi:hypothetical protein